MTALGHGLNAPHCQDRIATPRRRVWETGSTRVPAQIGVRWKPWKDRLGVGPRWPW